MKIGVSSCLLGNQCRYDGAHAKDDFVFDSLQNYFEIVPYCPEAIVFGTPRETIRLVEENDRIRVITNVVNKDVTETLESITLQCAQQIKNDDLCGFILKSKSPTCGLERVKVYEKDSHRCEKKGQGLFAREIQRLYPYLPIEEEGRLQDAWLKENFIMQVFAYKDLHDFLIHKPKYSDLVAFHTSYKYLIYAKSHKAYKELGGIVANHDKKSLEEVLAAYKEAFLKAIMIKGSIKNTYNVLLHIYGYFKKMISKEEKKEILSAIEEYKQQVIPLIAVVKIINLYTKRFNQEYLKTQKFLFPYPDELALRSSLKAYK